MADRFSRCLLVSGAIALLLIAVLVARGSVRHHRLATLRGLQKSANHIRRLAQWAGMDSIWRLALAQEDKWFQCELDLRVENGELGVIFLPAQTALNPNTFFPELGSVCRTNNLKTLYLQSHTVTNGDDFTLYVRGADRAAIVDYIEREKGVLTNPMQGTPR